jgi:preprotein translocase subunit SecY
LTDDIEPSVKSAPGYGAVITPILVTLLSLTVWRLGNLVPLSGLDLAVFSGMGAGGSSRFSLLALGTVPWLSAVLLVELAAVLLPGHIIARFTRSGHADPFSKITLVLTLIIAGAQGFGFASALEAAMVIVKTPGLTFQITTLASLVGGTVGMIALARLIEWRGVGHGFWVMLAAGTVAGLAPTFAGFALSFSQGLMKPLACLAAVGVDIVIIVAVIWLLGARRRVGFMAADVLLWPLLMPTAVVSFISIAAYLVSMNLANMGLVMQYLTPQSLIGLAFHTAIIFVLVLRYALREGSKSLLLPTTLIVVGAFVVPQMMTNALHINTLFGSGSSTVIVTAAFYLILQRIKDHGRTTSIPA